MSETAFDPSTQVEASDPTLDIITAQERAGKIAEAQRALSRQALGVVTREQQRPMTPAERADEARYVEEMKVAARNRSGFFHSPSIDSPHPDQVQDF